MTAIWPKLAAETAGTGFLVLAVIGSGIMAAALTEDTAVALLANSLATAAALAVLITVLGPVSGAHLNPAVTMAMTLSRDIAPATALAYAAAQFGGGLAGGVLAHLMFDLPAVQFATHIRTGPGQWLAEAVASFGLVTTIILGNRYRPQQLAGLVALYIGAAYWFTASTSFANPAATLARALSDTFAGIRLADAPAFVLAQLAGSSAAGLLLGFPAGRRGGADLRKEEGARRAS